MKYLTIILLLFLTACGSDNKIQAGPPVNTVESWVAEKRTGGICLMGDSITAAWPESLTPQGAYNRGISGNTTLDVMGRLWLTGLEQPDILYLMIGINDLGRGYSPESVAINVDIIVNEIRRISAGTIITVVGILPATPINYNIILAANKYIEEIIVGYPEVNFIDTLNIKIDTIDGVHPTYEGYTILSEFVFASGVEIRGM